MNTIIANESLKFVHGQIATNKKERFDIILEPMQAIIIFAFLSRFPIGTKISIHQNVLYVQEGDVLQGIRRWFNNDNKEDLYALYQVFQRFHYFYNRLNDSMKPFMELLHKMASDGLDNLVETYKGTDKISLLHSLHICKLLLKNPSLLNDNEEILNEKQSKKDKDTSKNKENSDKHTDESSQSKPVQKVDEVFKNVTSLYNKDYFQAIYYLLKQLENNKGSVSDLYHAYYLLSKQYHTSISSWIHSNVVF
jgi:hypothetical protein